jgi:hypothetical protein
MSTVGLGLLLSSEQVGTNLHTMISSFDLFSIWFFIVVAIGIVKIGKVGKAQGFGMVFGLWIIWTILTSFATAAFF